MSTEKLVDKLHVLRQTIEKAQHSYLYEFAAEEFNLLLDEACQHLEDKAKDIEKINVPNISALQSEKIRKDEILTKVNSLLKALRVRQNRMPTDAL